MSQRGEVVVHHPREPHSAVATSGGAGMIRFRIALSDDEQAVVNAERDAHPDAHVRRKMLVLWLLPCGVTRAPPADVAGLRRATIRRYAAAYRDGGLGGLRRWGVVGPV